jgi:hypothetical protein
MTYGQDAAPAEARPHGMGVEGPGVCARGWMEGGCPEAWWTVSCPLLFEIFGGVCVGGRRRLQRYCPRRRAGAQ